MRHSNLTNVLATVIATVSITAVAQADQINLTSGAVRIADSAGLTDRFFALAVNAQNRYYNTLNFPQVVRPNGATDWSFVGTDQVSQFIFDSTNGIDATTAEAWMQSNYVGNWQVSWDGTNTYTPNTSVAYTPLLQREYLEMTSSSVALFENIRTNGLTGTFTFTLTEPHYSKGQGRAYISGPSGYAAGTFLGGSTFELTITNALAADSILFLQYYTGAYLDTFASGDSAYMTQFSETVYGTGVIPAPGAIALLGLAGLTGRRRR
ncbi:MAG: hypothetical protein RL591_2359 [Planctomycetota bacterium]|jgi:hypothetical protein